MITNFIFLTRKLSTTIILLHFVCSVIAQRRDSLDIGTEFNPAGKMGCNTDIDFDPAWRTNFHSAPFCYRIGYRKTCALNWAGMYWTNTADDSGANWGQLPGTDLSARNFRRITFYARGETGGEVVEFGAFGIDNTRRDPTRYLYKDRCPKAIIANRYVRLEKNWVRYTINISCEDLSSVVGGFFWTASWDANPAGLTFYLDDIQFETE